MQDPDLKCRHFGILWHFMVFYGILWYFGIFAKKSNKKSNPIFPIFPTLSDFFLIFRLFPTFRLSDSTALIATASNLGVSFVGNLGSSTWHGGVSDGGYAGICSGSWGGD